MYIQQYLLVEIWEINCAQSNTSYEIFQISFELIQGVSWLVDITAGGDFLGLFDQKSSYKHVSDFGQLQSYDCLKLRIESNDYWQ